MLTSNRSDLKIEVDYYLQRSLHLLETASTIGFFLMLLSALIFAIGNFQGFVSKSQEQLLTIMRVMGIAFVGINTWALLFIVLRSFRLKKLLVKKLAMSLSSLILGLLLVLVAGFVLTLIDGQAA